MARPDNHTQGRRSSSLVAARAVPLQLIGRSLFPITALVLILGTLVWGPWVSLGLTFVWWRIVARFA